MKTNRLLVVLSIVALSCFVSRAEQSNAPSRLDSDAPVFQLLANRADVIAHVVVTNVSYNQFATVLGVRGGRGVCEIRRTVKGEPTNGTVVVAFALNGGDDIAPFEVGKEYIVFLRRSREVGVFTLVDPWFSTCRFQMRRLRVLMDYLSAQRVPL